MALTGVLARLRAAAIPIDTIVGCSVGAIVGALYAAGGLTPEALMAEARGLTPASVLSLAISYWNLPILSRRAALRTGRLREHLDLLGRASFDRLHHGVRRLGILTYDLLARREVLVYGGPGLPATMPVRTAVAASAAIPVLFPPVPVRLNGRRRLLVDAGWYTTVPVEHCFAPPVSAQRVLAVDLAIRLCVRQRSPVYWEHLREACGERLLLLQPDVSRLSAMLPRRGDAERLVAAGEAVVSDAILDRLRSWTRS